MIEGAKKNLILKMIKEKCMSDGIMQKEICLGLCDPAYMSRCISKNVEMDKLMLDAIMQRLGISTKSYAYILRDSEYVCFEIREKIRMHINNKRFLEANQLIEKYINMQEVVKGAKKLHLQTALLLKSYILEKEKVDASSQMQNVEKALVYTLPKDYEQKIETLFLSEVELLLLTRKALLLEIMQRKDEAYELYFKLYQRQLDKPYRGGELIHVFVVVDYHLSKLCFERGELELLKEILKNSIEALLKNNKVLLVAELLSFNKCLVENEFLDERQLYDYDAIKFLVLNYKKEWDPDIYFPLYREYDVYSFRKIIIQRRGLMRVSQEELSERCCCNKTTIERMEQGIVDTQSDIGYHILNVVGLPIEKSFSLLETEYISIKEMFLNALVALNNGDLKKSRSLCNQVKQNIDLDLIVNKQGIEWYNFLVFCKEHNITSEEKLKGLEEVLAYTLSLENIDKVENVILYGNEIDIVCSIAHCYEQINKVNMGLLLLEKIRKGYNVENMVGEEGIIFYLILSKKVESMYANKGDFKYANSLINECLHQVLEHDIAGLLVDYIYDKIWNKAQERKILDEDDIYELKGAYTLSVMIGDTYMEQCIKRLYAKYC